MSTTPLTYQSRPPLHVLRMSPARDMLAAPSHPQTSGHSDGVAQLLDSGHQPRRNRSQLSCTHCRHAKLKCDRNQPCSQCTKKGRASVCTFPAPAARRKPAVSMQNRLKHLESLVKDVMTVQVLASHPTSPSEENNESAMRNVNSGVSNTGEVTSELDSQHGIQSPENVPKEEAFHSSGQVLLSTNQTAYVGATHWAAILDDV
jgi:hypothetical protein